MDMGAQNNRFKKTENMIDLEKNREQLQFDIDKSKSIDERRKVGQFATPFALAREIMSYGLELLNKNAVSFLEPSLGTGAFYSALVQETKFTDIAIEKATGIEIDALYFNAAKSLWCNNSLKIYDADFTHLSPDGKYNFLIANPPYVRHHCISHEEKKYLCDCVKQETGIDVSGLAGLYCYFLLLSHKWLAPGAVCGWLIPSEFMDVNYGLAVKKYLLNNVHLLRIHRYNPDNSKFDDALVSSCVVWFKNEVLNDDYDIEFSYDGTHKSPLKSKTLKKTVLLSERKWTRFPEKEIRINEKNITTIGDYFTIKRGLATGDNHFFIFDREKVEKLGLDMSFFKPVLPSPRNLKIDCVETDTDGNPKLEKQYYLLDCRLSEKEVHEKYPDLWNYLQSGVLETGSKYICRNRKTWYFQEQRQATRFLCSYMGRGNKNKSPIRFILNLSNAIATNSYIMLYPKERLQQAISNNPDIVFQIWKELKTIAVNEIEDEARVYGGDLKKIEPKELAKVSCKGLFESCNIL